MKPSPPALLQPTHTGPAPHTQHPPRRPTDAPRPSHPPSPPPSSPSPPSPTPRPSTSPTPPPAPPPSPSPSTPNNIYEFDLGQDLTYSNITLSNGDAAQVDFVNPSFATAVGDGPVDLLFADVTTQTSTLYTGAQLYTGPESAPTFTNGLYSLLADSGAGSSATGTLLITDVPTPPITPTPEPSSLLLLATGALSAATTARRRLFPSCKL